MSTVRDKDSTDAPRREWVGVMIGDVLQALVINLSGVDGDPTDAIVGELWHDITGDLLRFKATAGNKTVTLV